MTNSLNAGAGVGQTLIVTTTFECAIKECDNMKLNKSQKAALESSKTPCATLGTMKHACVQDKMKDKPGTMSEASFDTKPDPPKLLMRVSNPSERCPNFWSAMKSMRAVCAAAGEAYKKGRMRRPDLVVGNGQPPQDVYDAKFPCSRTVKRGAFKGRNAFPSANKPGKFAPGQEDAYKEIAGDGKAKPLSPADVRNTRC